MRGAATLPGLGKGARIGVFDAGIGGVPFAALLRRRAPQHDIVYLGDAARRPYGPQSAADVTRYVAQAERFFAEAACDAWVVACNTASVVTPLALRGSLPCIDMVSAAQRVAPSPERGRLAVLATAGTVASGVLPRALPDHDVVQIATEDLLRLAEEGGGDDPVRLRSLVRQALQEVRDAGCRAAVLACTDFTCIGDLMAEVAEELAGEPVGPTAFTGGAPPWACTLIDPLEGALELLLDALDDITTPPADGRGPGELSAARHDRLCMTGEHPVDARRYAADEFQLALPPVEIVDLPAAEDPVTGSTGTPNTPHP